MSHIPNSNYNILLLILFKAIIAAPFLISVLFPQREINNNSKKSLSTVN